MTYVIVMCHVFSSFSTMYMSLKLTHLPVKLILLHCYLVLVKKLTLLLAKHITLYLYQSLSIRTVRIIWSIFLQLIIGEIYVGVQVKTSNLLTLIL